MHQPIPQVATSAATKYSFEVLPHPQYSPDLAHSDLYMFPNLKTSLRGRNSGSNEGGIDAVDTYLGDQEEGFHFDG